MKEDRRDTASEAGASLTAGEADDGCRVDALLSRLVPGMGVRGRRRFLKEGRALLNGRPVKAGTAVRTGDRLEIVPLKVSSSSMPEARLLARRGGFRVFSSQRSCTRLPWPAAEKRAVPAWKGRSQACWKVKTAVFSSALISLRRAWSAEPRMKIPRLSSELLNGKAV